MFKAKKNYTVYVLMLLIFGGLIYFMLDKGERFAHYSSKQIDIDVTPFQMFRMFIVENLHHPLSILLIQIIAVLLTVRLFGYLFKYIGQPGVIGEIVAGIVLGPSLLGYFYPEAFHFLFPEESLTNLGLLSQMGLVLFMFVIGMELDFKVLKNKINETLVISHAGILVPFLLGIIASFWIYEEYASSYTAFIPFALFIGISMSITAFPVLARIIQERNMTKKPIGILAIASAANDDVTAWCLLAVVIAIAKAGTFGSALYTIGLTVTYIVTMFLVVRPFLKKVGAVYANNEVINKSFVAFIFLILIISATITEIIGIHALFGAFMAGVVMPSNLGFRKVMMEKVEDIALVFFLPLFFAFTGLRTEIGLINTPELWGVCLLLVTVAVVGKLGGCSIASRLVGESWKDSLIIGTLMNTRGLMELVALNIGYEMGVLPPSIFVILVIMALVTTFMTTPLLHFVERIFAHQKDKLSTKHKLLLCFGRPETGPLLLSVFDSLFGHSLKKEQIIAAHYTVGSDVNPLNAEQYAKDSFIQLHHRAAELGVKIDTHYRVTDKLVQEIIKYVNQEHPDMLLLGAGSKYYNDKPVGTSRITWLSLFRDKIGEVREQVTCPVAVLINRNYKEDYSASFVISGKVDDFMFVYLEQVLKNDKFANLYWEANSSELEQRVQFLEEKFPQQLTAIAYKHLEDFLLTVNNGELLILSHSVYSMLLEDDNVFKRLPSMLVIDK